MLLCRNEILLLFSSEILPPVLIRQFDRSFLFWQQDDLEPEDTPSKYTIFSLSLLLSIFQKVVM